MERYTIMVMGDERSPMRRFQVPKVYLRRAVVTGVGIVLVLALGTWDYSRMRGENAELGELRVETSEQARQIQLFETKLARVKSELQKVHDLERKVRIIANLPGAAAVGGAEVTELVPPHPDGTGDELEDEQLMLPAGVPVELDPAGDGNAVPPMGGDDPDLPLDRLIEDGLTSDGARHVKRLGGTAEVLAQHASVRTLSLEELVEDLEAKRTHLLSMPSVWPTRGWLTSRFGPRISPFTGKRQRHSGIDIAAKAGSDIIAPARGRVASVGSRGPLGNSLVVDHGYGVKTLYGHAKEIFVSAGDEVVRGQKLAAVGSSGRSTGPHLHYGVHIEGKAQDPLNYIFD